MAPGEPDAPGADPAWEAAAAFLAARAFPAPPEVIETHTARVFLTEGEAWKLRRPVDYGFLDYATRARRRAMAEREIALNDPAAPGLYLGLGGVAADGATLLRPGETVPETAEPLVVMRRFEAASLFDRMAEEGRLDGALMAETGRAVAALHRARAEAGETVDLPALFGPEAEAIEAARDTLGPDRAEALAAGLRAAARRLAPLAAGRPLRLCHGDLHLRNIVLWKGRPAPFDCVEFSESIARVDPLYDLAFLSMDLRHRGLDRLVPALLSAWAEALASEPGAAVDTAYGGLALLAPYEACRAAIRAKIAVLSDKGAEARAYADLALARLAPAPAPRLLAVGGLSGSGKSTLARALAAETGAVVLRSDAVRKGLAGVAPEAALPPESYTEAAARRVAEAMHDRAGRVLRAGLPALLDATHLDAEDRRAAAALAERLGVGFEGLWLAAPEAALEARIAARRGDVSDAGLGVLRGQIARLGGACPEPLGPGWRALSAEGAPEEVAARARGALGI